MMKRLIFIITMLMAVTVQAADIGIVVKNNTSRLTVGVDTLLGDFITATLGKTIDYRDLDSVFTPAAWDAFSYDCIVFVGENVSGGGAAWNLATVAADSVAKSNTPFLCIGNAFYNESNLGTGAQALPEGTGYVININKSHWISKVLQDTVILWSTSAAIVYSMTIPDTGINNIDVLLLDKDYRVDTSTALLSACEAGDTVYNTGDGRIIANQRRVFFGAWQYQSQTIDSCQFYTIFGRSVAWLYGDTMNAGIMEGVCFSGFQEIEHSCVVENSAGTDSIEWYTTWPDLYTGIDYDDKHFYIKPRTEAIQRKITNVYRSLSVDLARWRMVLKAKAYDGTDPETYTSTWSMAPLIRYWQAGRGSIGYFSEAAPFACWTYRYGEGTGVDFVAYAWDEGAAQSVGVDMLESYIDSIVITQDSLINRVHYLDVDTVHLNTVILDSSQFFGWVANTTSATYTGPGFETAYYSTTNSVTYRPYLTMHFDAYSTTVPTPTIAIDAGAYDADSIVFTGILGQTIASQTVQVTNSAGGALECLSIADDVAWSTIIADETNTPMSFTMYIPFGQQAVGYRSGTVTVTCADATNSPKTFKIVSLITAATARQAKGAVEIR